MGKKNAELPVLNSERKAYLEQIKEANKRADEVYGVCHRKFMGIVMRALFLTTEQKEKLAEEINK